MAEKSKKKGQQTPDAAGSKKGDDAEHQKGGQTHAEGQHGGRSRERLLEQLHSGGGDADDQQGEGYREQTRDPHGGDGAHRLFEQRQQHDEAEKNSEKNRLSRDVNRHHHDREEFQLPGGAERHPKMPRED